MQRKIFSDAIIDWIQTAGFANSLTPEESSQHIVLGRFEETMQTRLGCLDYEIATSVATLDKMMFDHGVPASHLKKLMQMIQNPAAIYRSATHPDSSVVIVSTQNLGGQPILIPIWLNKQSRTGKQPDHWISSAYKKSNPHILQTWDSQGYKIWP